MSETNGALVAVPRNSTLSAGHRATGLVPQSFEDVQRIANMAVASGLFKGNRDDNKDSLLAKATMAIMQGLECGVPPMQAVQSIAVINGKCAMYGDLLKAVIWAAGFKIHEDISGTGDARTATCTITRPTGETITRTFSVADAKKARLWDDREKVTKYDKTVPNDSAWHRFPDRMLAWRAFGFSAKDGASDATRGLLVREDVESDSAPADQYSAVAVKSRIAELPMPPAIPSMPTEVPQVPLELGLEPLPENYMESLEATFAAVKSGDRDSLNEAWESHEYMLETHEFSPDQKAKANQLFHDHQGRITL